MRSSSTWVKTRRSACDVDCLTSSDVIQAHCGSRCEGRGLSGEFFSHFSWHIGGD